MERKRVSALSLYQSLSRGTAAHTPGDAAPAQKHRKKENGVQEKLKHDVKKKKKKQKARAVKRESAEAESACVSAVLTDLMRLSNSRERADRLFQWLIHPVQEQNFFRDNWEKKPIVIQRRNRGYYSGLFSTAELDAILRSEEVQYGVNLDVTSYRDGRRETHNPAGRALPYSVWDFYEGGCSLRMLNPQAFSSTVWQVLSILQEKFGSMAGANVYLTPPGTQGFAPHYDDIEAFIVQLEGKKHWRVYAPRSADETLPLVSSPNFSQAEIGRPVTEVLLEAGDLLYLPRGFIHQGECQGDAHSLHITISTYQRNSWGELLLKLVPAALGVAMEEEVEFRKGLPLDYLQFMGVQNSEKVDVRRERFLAHTRALMKKLLLYAPVDAAVDQKARDVMHDLLPPALSSEETSSSVCGAPARWRDGGTLDVSVPLQGKTRIRLIRAGAARLCSDGDAVSLFYTTENSRVYHKDDARSLEIQSQHIDAVELLIHSYPDFVSVASLPCDSMEAKVSLTELLFQRGLIHTDRALTACPAQ